MMDREKELLARYGQYEAQITEVARWLGFKTAYRMLVHIDSEIENKTWRTLNKRLMKYINEYEEAEGRTVWTMFYFCRWVSVHMRNDCPEPSYREWATGKYELKNKQEAWEPQKPDSGTSADVEPDWRDAEGPPPEPPSAVERLAKKVLDGL